MDRPGRWSLIHLSFTGLIATQTFGANFKSNGCPQDTLYVQMVQCDQTVNTCSISVPALGVALIFLTDAALMEVTNTTLSMTFSTTFLTKTKNTLTTDLQVLVTSNRHAGMDANKNKLGSTSQGSISAVEVTGRLDGSALVFSVIVFGAMMVGRGLVMWWTRQPSNSYDRTRPWLIIIVYVLTLPDQKKCPMFFLPITQ